MKTYGQFVTESNKDKDKNESFTISLEQMPTVGDIVDNVDWKEGEKIAFVDFKGVKNIPVQVVVGDDTQVETQDEPEMVSEMEPEVQE